MPTELYEATNVFAPAFAFDADSQWTKIIPFETTNKRVEGKGTVADFIASRPKQATIEGLVTAMTIAPALPDPQKLVNMSDRLEQLADKQQLVLVLSELFAGYMAIDRAEISKGTEDGYSFRARITLKRIELTTVGTAQVPASKLKAKVKRRGASGKKGGSAQGGIPKTLALRSALGLGLGRLLKPF
jgi:hypothetical protein